MDDEFNMFIESMPFRSTALIFQNICTGSNDILNPLLILLGYGIVILVISIRIQKVMDIVILLINERYFFKNHS